MTAVIIIDSMDKRPIYEQIVEKIEDLTISGYYKSGDQLPSVKQLACELSINPNTIQRAYRDLETQGYIYSVPGKGSFFLEQLAKTGAGETYMIYGEVGLDHGPEWMSAKITNISTALPSALGE